MNMKKKILMLEIASSPAQKWYIYLSGKILLKQSKKDSAQKCGTTLKIGIKS